MATLPFDEMGPFERAMARVFDPSDHEERDVIAVTVLLEHTDLGKIGDRALPEIARAWLDAAAFARERGVVPELLVMGRLVMAMGGVAAEHAESLLARAAAANQLVPARMGDVPEER